jgi:hypothetical protein
MIYILQEQVDLGSHLRGVFLQKQEAEDNLAILSKIHNVLYGRSKLFIQEIEEGHMKLCTAEREIQEKNNER